MLFPRDDVICYNAIGKDTELSARQFYSLKIKYYCCNDYTIAALKHDKWCQSFISNQCNADS